MRLERRQSWLRVPSRHDQKIGMLTEIIDCLPPTARRYFIDLRNNQLGRETERYQTRLKDLRAQLAARNQGRSGWQEVEEWKYKEEMLDSLAIGYVQDAFATCQLYDIPLTRPVCDCLVRAAEQLVTVQYRAALQAQGQGVADVKIPLSVRQDSGTTRLRRIMSQIRPMIEAARVEDERKRIAVTQENEKYANKYTQVIMQHGGVINASQTGNVSAQQLTVEELGDLGSALASMRSFFKNQAESVDADEYIGLLASAQKAANEKDEGRMLGCLKQIPSQAWEIGKTVIPQVLLHYLKLHGLA